MYTSDDRGILFSKSLERHLFDGQRKSDFTNITSLRGVYLTNKLDVGKHLHVWVCVFGYLPRPENTTVCSALFGLT